MSEGTDAALRRAHELIENDQLEQARELLTPLLETAGNNPALWWVYAHALADSETGLAALDRLLALDPTYPGARELKAQALSAQGEPAGDLYSALNQASVPSSVASFASFADESKIDDWEAIKPSVEEPPANSRAGRGFVLIVVALLILASGAVFVLSGAVDLGSILTQDTAPTAQSTNEAPTGPIIVVIETGLPESATALPPTPASTAAAPIVSTIATAIQSAEAETQPTLDPTLDPTLEPTLLPTATLDVLAEPTATATLSPAQAASFIELISRQITDFPIDTARSSARATQLGMTIDVLVCSAAGQEFNARLNAVLDAAADTLASMPAQVAAFAVSLLDCANPNDSVRTIGVSRASLADYAAGIIAADAFQEAWQLLA